MNHRRPGRGPAVFFAVLGFLLTALGLYLALDAAVKH